MNSKIESVLDAGDWFVVVFYFVIVFGVAIWATVREKSTRKTSKGYFLAGRNVGWFIIGGSLFASNIGSEHLVGLAGSGAKGGVAVAQFEILASLVLLLLGWVFVPFYLKSGVVTMPEFLERRYSSGARWYLAIISVIGYVLTKISVTIAAGGIVFQSLMGVEFWTGALIVVVATGVYTIFGGLRAVLYTDLVQMFVLIGGSVAVTAIGLGKVGGFEGLRETLEPGFFDMWKASDHPEFPWTGIIFGAPLLGIWYWCTDQFIVQRVLSAKNQSEARRGTVFAGALKVLPLFLFVVPGMIAIALVKQGSMELDDNDAALPTLIAALLPGGVRGIVVAGMLAALMSSLSSVFNSCSTLLTWDIYRKLNPGATERQLVVVGQTATVVLVGFGLLWIPLMELVSQQLYTYIQSVQAYIAPPIAAVFLIGLFWTRVNARGAMASLLTGFVLGMARLFMEIKKEALSGFFEWYASINFLHFAGGLFVVCTMVLILVSLSAPPPPPEQLRNLTYATVPAEEEKDPRRARDLTLSLGVIALVAIVWVVFSKWGWA